MATLHKYQTNDGWKIEELTRAKAIRAKCLECSAWQQKEVRECPVTDCALWPFRMKYPVDTSLVESIQAELDQG